MSKSLSMKLNIAILLALIISLITYYLKLIPNYESAALIVIDILATIPVIVSALNALKHKKVSVDLLASIALLASLLHQEWASVAFINLMITSARIFGNYIEGKADQAIKSLLKLRPEKVKIKTQNGIEEVPIEKVKVGDLVVVETGDRIPVDGVIVEGEASLDQSSLTGESMPVTKSKGQKVFSSTLNLTGSFIMTTEKIGKDTTLEKIVALIESAQASKVSIQTSADKFASIYITITLLAAIVLFLITQNLTLILAILLVTCADDIAVAIPMAFWGAIASAARHGIIIKGGSFLEGLTKIKTLIVDKTGTLTKGTVKTQNIICFGKIKSHEALGLIASVESVSEHPIAKAITLHATQDGIPIVTPEKFKEYAGRGIIAFQKNEKIAVGNLKFMKDQKIKFKEEQAKIAEEYQRQGYNVVFLGFKGELVALVTLADQVRSDAKSTIQKLKSLGIKNIIMLTGDNQLVAARVAKETGVTSFHAGLLPEEKLKFIKKYIDKRELVAMVGDGVNDAASLKLADIGIAMGAIGADAAIESADIALMQDDFSKVVNTIKLGKYTQNIAKQNFLIWGVVNIIGLVLVFTSTIGPQGAAAWNFITDFFPIANSLRVLRHKVTN